MLQPPEQPLDDDDEDWGVLLYYKFVPLPDPERVAAYLEHLCSALSLRGRVRVAPDGLNVTVTGTLKALQTHTAALHAHPRFAFPPIDFKLSPAPPFAAVPPHLAIACGFASLSVRLCPYLITLTREPPSIAGAGPLVSPREFHSLLQAPSENCVLIDARNIYETRIGKFEPPPHVLFLDPLLRQYSDLPGWIDAHQEQLRNKRVLMYCTGGVRCELASSYLRSKGKEFKDVIQLSGGIHRYMEAYADGGYFKGKNFVFDHRMAVASRNDEVIGRCLLCHAPFDDYSARTRCSFCRLLVLVCESCQGAEGAAASPVKYVCELCEMNRKATSGNQPQQIEVACDNVDNDVPAAKHTQRAVDLKPPSLHEGRTPTKKLRLLCLHGFRQNASGFKGRLGSLQKKLKHVADLVFVDAPHKLPFIQQDRPETGNATTTSELTQRGTLECFAKESPHQSPTSKFAWLVSPSTDAHGSIELEPQPRHPSEDLCPPSNAAQKTMNGAIRKAPFDPRQFETQTEGWGVSWEYLQRVFRDLGPFDGALGFSQGASVAAALCQLRGNGGVDFKFAVLCSGYAPVFQFSDGVGGRGGLIACPSLHIFGGQDRQICDGKSEQLADLFASEERTVVKHTCGHIIPTQPAFVEQYVEFFSQFL